MLWEFYNKYPVGNNTKQLGGKFYLNYLIFFYLNRSDSVTWNPHKLMGALLQCSTIHFKEDVSLIFFYFLFILIDKSKSHHSTENYVYKTPYFLGIWDIWIYLLQYVTIGRSWLKFFIKIFFLLLLAFYFIYFFLLFFYENGEMYSEFLYEIF